MTAVVTRPYLLENAESILPPPQTLTGSLGHPDVERITPEFHLGLDGTQNKRWNLEQGKTKAFEYDASGKKLREWKYEYNDKTKKHEWQPNPIK